MTSLSRPDAMISVVSLVRRGSVVISFLCGAALFKEKNLKAKAFDLALILLGMFFIWLGSSLATFEKGSVPGCDIRSFNVEYQRLDSTPGLR